MNSLQMHDVVIAGGGPAGLSAALLLGRRQRDTVLCDAGRFEIESFPSTGGFLGNDGCHPSELLKAGRDQVAKFDSVTHLSAWVSDVRRTSDGFSVICADGRILTTKTLLISPGSSRQLPNIEGAGSFYGRSLHQFPSGEGWKRRGQRLGVLGSSDDEVQLAMKLLAWSNQIILFSNGGKISKKSCQLLHDNRIMIELRSVSALQGTGDRLEMVRLEDGTCLPCEALFYSASEMGYSGLAVKLGCDARHFGHQKAWVPDGGTGIQGLFFAGNPFTSPEMAIIAAADGVKAAQEADRWLTESERSYLAVKSA